MKLFRLLPLIAATSFLSGCLSMDYAFDFANDGTVRETLTTKVKREVWNSPFFDASEICADAERVNVGGSVHCIDASTQDIDYLISQSQHGSTSMNDEFFPVQVTSVSSNVVEVRVDMATVSRAINDNPQLKMSFEMITVMPAFANALQTEYLTISFSGEDIISTTGRVNTENTRTYIKATLEDVLSGENLPAPLVAQIQVKSSCWFGFICL